MFLIKEQHGDYKITDEELENQFFDKFEEMYNNDNLLFDEKTLRKVTTALNEEMPGTNVSNVAMRGHAFGQTTKRFGHEKIWGS